MKRRGTIPDYGWVHVEEDLAAGVHPAVVAARLGEPEDYIRDVADAQGWLITWKAPCLSAQHPQELDHE